MPELVKTPPKDKSQPVNGAFAEPLPLRRWRLELPQAVIDATTGLTAQQSVEVEAARIGAKFHGDLVLYVGTVRELQIVAIFAPGSWCSCTLITE